jgi:hypothetical protein
MDVFYVSVGLFYLLVGLFFLLDRCAHKRMHPCNNQIGLLIIYIRNNQTGVSIIYILLIRTCYCLIMSIIIILDIHAPIILGASARVAAGHLA